MRSVHAVFGIPAALVALLCVAVGCSSSSSSGRGGVGDPCADVSDCEPGLFCGADGRCYSPSDGGPDGGGTDGGGDGSQVECIDLDRDGHDAWVNSCPGGDDCDDDDPR